MSYSKQQQAIHHFHTGDLNILIATTIAEEGIDIPDCNMIIRFDLYKTMIQYVQSKGRARSKTSKYFHMIEIGNQEHKQKVYECREKEEVLHNFCTTLPTERLIRGNDFDMDFFLRKEKMRPVYVIEGTGAKLTYESSLVVLATYVSSLRQRSDVPLRAHFIVKSVGKEFQCEVIMPDNCPIRSMIGKRASSKQVAKCSAAYQMCVQLRKKAELDGHLQPKYRDIRPAMRNAQLALSSKKQAQYNMITKPACWNERGPANQLYMTIFKLDTPAALGRCSRPLAMLTRTALPQIPRFPIFFGNEKTSMVDCLPLRNAITISSSELDSLTTLTLRIFDDVFSKVYEPEPEKLPYYFAPLNRNHTFDFSIRDDARAHLDWDCISMIQRTPSLDPEGQPEAFFKNKFVNDPYDGSRKFYTTTCRNDLKPRDPQLPGLKWASQAQKGMPYDIWNYSVSLWSKSKKKMEVRDDLQVVEAEYLSLRRNLLDEFEKSGDGSKKCYLVFATLKISAVSAVDLKSSRVRLITVFSYLSM